MADKTRKVRAKARRVAKKKRPQKAPAKRAKYVVVSNKSYGHALRKTKIYFEGPRPRALQDDGRIQFGKHILETLGEKFSKFRWVITATEDSVKESRGITYVRTSQRLLTKMNKENWDRSRDIKLDIVSRFFSLKFPDHFAASGASSYAPGSLALALGPNILSRLSSEDKDALAKFVPAYLESESISAVNQLKAATQIRTLRGLADTLEGELLKSHSESWWQTYVRANILLMQQGYIKALEKLNVAVGDTRFPDFCLVTHDGYLDILEIKKPDTGMLRLDASRGNYYWDTEVAKAISQTENYIEQVGSKAAEVRSFLLDKEKLDIKAIRPRGIILAGNASVFEDQKQKDDFRLLSQGLKSITIVTYDELLARLRNYIAVLATYTATKKKA